jgi:hypothetical protein
METDWIVAGVPPKVTVVTAPRPVPEIVTTVLPACVPLVGDSEEIDGGGPANAIDELTSIEANNSDAEMIRIRLPKTAIDPPPSTTRSQRGGILARLTFGHKYEHFVVPLREGLETRAHSTCVA